MASDNSSRGLSGPLWFLGILAVGGAALLGLPRPADHPSANGQQQAAAKEEDKAESTPAEEPSGPLAVLRDYLRVQREQEKPTGFHIQLTRETDGSKFSIAFDEKPVTGASLPLSHYVAKESARYEFLIATVPDPVETKFPHEFDSVVAAIQRAFEARGSILRVSRLPWTRGRGSGQANGNGKAPPHREYPGVLLFRQSRSSGEQGPPIITVVCLVGESPISGLHKPALFRALEAWDELDKAINDAKKTSPVSGANVDWAGDDPESRQTLRIVSPYYTGSQASLIQTLRQWQTPQRTRPTLKLMNGSATALVLQFFADAKLDVPHSTVIPSEFLTRGVLQYLAGSRGMQLDPIDGRQIRDRVAILREANTSYGAQATARQRDPKSGPKTLLAQQLIVLPFPVSISQLEVDPERVGKPQVVLPHTEFVEPRLQPRDQTQLDALPPYDPQAAASTAGQSLRTILTTIDRARVRYVGIEATDARDVVFLNRLIRKECPGVRVFTTEPSITLLHPEDSHHMRGMVVASTYPLHAVAQYWARTESQAGPSMIPFPTQSSQGYYNAILAQFDRPDLMLGYHPPLVPGTPGRLDRPPIWISVIGEGGRLIPVHCYTDYDDTQELTVPPSKPGGEPTTIRFTPVIGKQELGGPTEPHYHPVVGVPVGVLLGSVGAMLALGLVIAVLSSPRMWRLVAGLTRAEVEVGNLCGGGWVWVWRGVLLAAVLLFAIPFSLPARECWDRCCGLPGEQQGPAGWEFVRSAWRQLSVFGMAFVITCEVVAVVVLLVLRGVGVLATHPGETKRGYVVLAAVVAGAVVLTLAWWLPQTPADRFFLYVRSTDMTAGLAPWIPMGLLAATAFVLGWCCLEQADMARRVGLMCPYPPPWSKVAAADQDLREAFQRPEHVLRHPVRSGAFPTTFGLGILFVVCFLWNAFIIPLPSEEGSAWDWTMRLTFWATAAAVVVILARFLALWSRLAGLLDEILRVPMVAAFGRLPHEIGRLFGGYLFSQKPHHRQLAAAAWALPVEARNELAALIAVERPGLAWVFGETVTAPPFVGPPRVDEDERRDREDREWLAARLHDYAGGYLKQLPGRWRDQSPDTAFGADQSNSPEKPDSKKAKRSPAAEAQQFVAAFVVLYLGGYFAQLRILAYAVAFATPLLLLSAASYPFQPDRPRLTALLALLAAVAVSTLYVLYRINKDGLVSRITRTTPNRFTPDVGFLSSVTTYVLPLVVLVVLQVLGLFRFIVEPVLGLLG